jgi:hypothetical protein
MTVTTTTDDFNVIVERLLRKYARRAPAAVLFYWNNGSTWGVRVEAPSIFKEFIDNVGKRYIYTVQLVDGLISSPASDPEGVLFYYDIGDLDNDPKDKNDITHYNVFHNTGVKPGEEAAVIQFYKKTPGKWHIFLFQSSHESHLCTSSLPTTQCVF